jgi:hypothetical protein
MYAISFDSGFANIPVVAPTSPYMIGWRIFIMALIILYFYVIPIYIAWGSIFFNVNLLLSQSNYSEASS